MAKKISVSLEKEYLRRIDSYARKIDQLYLSAIREATSIGLSISNYDASKPFTWSSYPQTKARIDKLINNLYSNVITTIDDATYHEWLAANTGSDVIVKKFLSNTKLKQINLDHYYDRNLEALKSFQRRKIKGLNLSDRIWGQSLQFKNEMEMCLDIGLSEGRSASELSRDIRKYLNEPDRLYRRIKNKETGNYYLSQNAKKYNPGTGMYRSSYKNAMRVTRTETNMAYRSSDVERFGQLDFVVGYEVRRSNNVFCCNVCEALAGKYPKTFKFNGWHPQCRCYVVSILATPEEFIAHQRKILKGENPTLKSRNEVAELPSNFKAWVKDNSAKIAKAKSAPYFLRDNFSSKDISKGLKPIFS